MIDILTQKQRSYNMSKEPDADFKEVGGQFWVVFRRKDYKPALEEWSETGLTERQVELTKAVMQNPKVSRRQLSKLLGINQSAVQKNLDSLKEKGVLKRIGPGKGGHWEVQGRKGG